MSNTFKDYQLHTYGCKVNTYDSGLLQKRLSAKGVNYNKQSNVHILNTCAVTAEATKEALKQIRRIKSKDPFSKVVVTGCAAQVDTEEFNIPGADLVVANSHKGQIESLVEDLYKGKLDKKIHHSNIFKKEDLEVGGGIEMGHTRSFLKIQDGCNSFCTYCVIPFARGKSRSIPISQLVDKVQELYDGGIREVVLTGVHIADYASHKTNEEILAAARGRKNPDKFYYLEDLVEQLLIKTKIPRFRLSSLEPLELNERLIELYQEEAMCPHFHMSIQSANTKVLQAMKRKYNAKDVEFSLNQIQSKINNAFVGMDVIAGFPGETKEEFEDTYRRLQSLDWSRIHVFPYSERPGTKAVNIKDKVKQNYIGERAKKLRQLSSERFAKKALEQVGKTKKCLVLQNGNKKQAIARDYWTIHFDENIKFASDKEYEFVIQGYDHAEKSRMNGILQGKYITKV